MHLRSKTGPPLGTLANTLNTHLWEDTHRRYPSHHQWIVQNTRDFYKETQDSFYGSNFCPKNAYSMSILLLLIFFLHSSDSTCSHIGNNQLCASHVKKNPYFNDLWRRWGKDMLRIETVIYLYYFIIILSIRIFFRLSTAPLMWGKFFAMIGTTIRCPYVCIRILKMSWKERGEDKQVLLNWHVCLIKYQYLGLDSKLWLSHKGVAFQPTDMCQVCVVGGEDWATERKWCTNSLQGSFVLCCFVLLLWLVVLEPKVLYKVHSTTDLHLKSGSVPLV